MLEPTGKHSLRDWLRLRPLLRRWKTWRYGRVTRAHCRRAARDGDLPGLVAAARGRQLLLTVAYEDPQAIAWQVALVHRHLPDVLHVVADNSHDDARADRIRTAVAALGGHNIRLPRNPWGRQQPSRSHGLAMNWVWLNLVRPGAPRAFGFIDHDLWPIGETDPFAMLEARAFDGAVRMAGDAWFLWAGFCFFRFDAVAALALDFSPMHFAGLDTGGANWPILYRGVDRRTLSVLPRVPIAILEDVPAASCYAERMGAWLHEVGLDGDPALAVRKRQAIAGLLAPHLGSTPP